MHQPAAVPCASIDNRQTVDEVVLNSRERPRIIFGGITQRRHIHDDIGALHRIVQQGQRRRGIGTVISEVEVWRVQVRLDLAGVGIPAFDLDARSP